MDAAVRKMFTVSKEDIVKHEAEWKHEREQEQKKKKRAKKMN